MALNADFSVAGRSPLFREALDFVTLNIGPDKKASFAPGTVTPVMDRREQIWQALVTGTRDYLKKINVGEVVLGMSGGIDSAIVAAIAADAIGAKNVHLISMPYKYTTAGTRSDARAAAQMLGAPFEEIPIGPAVEGLKTVLGDHFNPASKTAANENDQARVRGTTLMHISNEKGWLVLSTGNKSEVSVGYCTLYGDMNGGFNPLKDVEKTMVFELSRWRNANVPSNVLGPKGPVMPQSIIDRPPSAELAPGQTDEKNLPPYDILDAILHKYVVEQKAVAEIVKEMELPAQTLIAGGRYKDTAAMVEEIVRKTDVAEFKRRQACPGVKISERSFGKGRRMPISRPSLPKMMKDIGGLTL
jgi:NAD+ synthase